ncbi:MAG: hypothetical protein ACK4SX_14580 [Alcanivoracaceae bacterium]
MNLYEFCGLLMSRTLALGAWLINKRSGRLITIGPYGRVDPKRLQSGQSWVQLRTDSQNSVVKEFFTTAAEGKSALAVQHGTIFLASRKWSGAFHLRNIFTDGELDPGATVKEFLIVRIEEVLIRMLRVFPAATSYFSYVRPSALTAPSIPAASEGINH